MSDPEELTKLIADEFDRDGWPKVQDRWLLAAELGQVTYAEPPDIPEQVRQWAERAGITPITFDDLVRIAAKIEIPERPSDD